MTLVRIGDRYINMDNVTVIMDDFRYDEYTIVIRFAGDHQCIGGGDCEENEIHLTGEERTAFIIWCEQHAAVIA